MSNMKVVLIGLAQSGKSQVFRSLGGEPSGETFEFSTHVANIKVPDERLTRLGEIFKPPKIVYADIDIMDIT